MEKISDILQHYIQEFKKFEQNLNGSRHRAVHEIRRKALQVFQEAGFPSKKHEDWRHTSLDTFLQHRFLNLPEVAPEAHLRRKIKPFLFKDWDGPQLVFINGHFQEDVSQTSDDFVSVTVTPLNRFLSDHPERASELISEELLYKNNAFGALNTAFLQDGAYIEVSAGKEIKQPIHLIYVSIGNDALPASYPRTIIRMAENSAASVVESYVSLGKSPAFTNAVTHMDLNSNARLEHYKLHNENIQTFHFSNTVIRQGRDSRLVSLNLSFGGKLVRNNLHSLLSGPGAEAILDGLYIGHKEQHIDNHTVIEHVSPHCNSHELYQGILTDQARAVFSGLIYVHRDAQKTDAKQSNNCLLLSEDAKIDSKPQLEIYADDVKCTHGATVGQLDKTAIFYLRSRGIGEQRAKNILTYAFAEKVIENIKIEPLRERVDSLILERFKEDMNFVK